MNRELVELSKGESTLKWIKGQRISWLGHLERMKEDRMPKISSLKNWKRRDEEEDQERMERISGKRASSAGSEKMERIGEI
jgi:hypothetical protein